MDKIIEAIKLECIFQDEKWGVQNHDNFKWYAILGEEFGEVGKAMLELSYASLSPICQKQLRKEITQTAAVCVAWLECIDRVGGK